MVFLIFIEFRVEAVSSEGLKSVVWPWVDETAENSFSTIFFSVFIAVFLICSVWQLISLRCLLTSLSTCTSAWTIIAW